MHTPNTKQPVAALNILSHLKRAQAPTKGEDGALPSSIEGARGDDKRAAPEGFAGALRLAMTSKEGALATEKTASAASVFAASEARSPIKIAAKDARQGEGRDGAADARKAESGRKWHEAIRGRADLHLPAASERAQDEVSALSPSAHDAGESQECEYDEADPTGNEPTEAIEAPTALPSAPGRTEALPASSVVPVVASTPGLAVNVLLRAAPEAITTSAPQPTVPALDETEASIVASALERIRDSASARPRGEPDVPSMMAARAPVVAMAPVVSSTPAAPARPRAIEVLGESKTGVPARVPRTERSAAVHAAYVVEAARGNVAEGIALGSDPSVARPASPAEPVSLPTISFGSLVTPGASPAMFAVHASPYAHRTQWTDEVAGHLAWMAKGDLASAELVLNPANLGRVAISLSMKGTEASFVFATEQAAARDLIEQALPALRDHLVDAGLRPGQTTVALDNRVAVQDPLRGWADGQDARAETTQSFSQSPDRRGQPEQGAPARTHIRRDAHEEPMAGPARATTAKGIDLLA